MAEYRPILLFGDVLIYFFQYPKFNEKHDFINVLQMTFSSKLEFEFELQKSALHHF